ncbi:sodium-dependent transporter [Hyphobacterium marinum]|uniref:Transporter n=1 Tax=Hyphobacterium marinum TaxID=3116574 RepID=A0ABU7LZL7_9PROT|nr:sodium-dependent transporter [Hyphobacterium sp. Y6023]MEE2566975.1 sodium-dependent transporter [Hyphobacterium sp. Y6023]
MAVAPSTGQSGWSSHFGFLMAAIGSSVGLGNFWRFPYTAGENGGAAFVLVYVICIILIGFPLLMSELSVGRHAKLSAVGSVRKIALDNGSSGAWSIVGWVGLVGGMFILCFYSVVAGWVTAYITKMATGEFVGQTPQQIADGFEAFTADPYTVIAWHSAFMVLTIAIVARGVTGGIEKVASFLMPLFFIMLLGLVGYAIYAGDPGAAVTYLFSVDVNEIRPSMVLAAVGQAFFSIGLGSAIMITYGSYLSRKENIAQSAGIISFADTFVAIIAGMAIFPFVFAFTALEPNAGPALFFQALPAAFEAMPAGHIVGAAFFFLALIAAITSSISLLQAVVAWAEEHTDLGRGMIAVVFGGLIWLVGVGAAFSAQYFDFLDFISGSIALPLAGLLMAVFIGWIVNKQLMADELTHASKPMFGFWRFSMRFIAPVALTVVLVLGLDDRFGWGLSALLFGG